MNNDIAIPEESILTKILFIRGKKVMLDKDLAELYQVETKQLKRQRRNIERFPEDFMFIISKDEFETLRSHFGTSSWGGVRYLPMALTEQGIAMLSSVLNSKIAIQVNIRIIRVFSKMRMLLEKHQEILIKLDELERKGLEHDKKIELIFNYIKHFEELRKQEEEQKNRRKIGFKIKED